MWTGRFSRQPLLLLKILLMMLFCTTAFTVTLEMDKVIPEPAVDFAPRQYHCLFSKTPVHIDGRDHDEVWQRAEWSAAFVDIEGPPRTKPEWETRVKMAWDNSYFYILAFLEEPEVWATLKRRDSVIFQDNDFEVFIDPDGDTHNYYELEINSFGTIWDLFLDRPYRDGGCALDAWDIQGLRSAVRVDGTLNRPGDRDRGWWVELAIPWDVLKQCAPGKRPPPAGEAWRINFSRVEWRVEVKNGKYIKVTDPSTGKPYPECNWVWSPQGVVNMHYPEMWGYVHFSGPLGKSGNQVKDAGVEEDVKWFLRRIYYRQRNFFAGHGTYAASLEALGLEQTIITGFGPTALHVTPGMFEASCSTLDGRVRWSIRQDGLVWKEKR